MPSFVSAFPEAFGAAAQNLTTIGSALSAAHTAAAGSTMQVVAAAQDEVSAAIAGVFGSYAQGYQAVAAQAAAFHDQFTGNLLSGANSYAATDAQNIIPVKLPGGGTFWATSEQQAARIRQYGLAGASGLFTDLSIAQKTVVKDGSVARTTVSKDEQVAQTTVSKDARAVELTLSKDWLRISARF